MNMYDETLLRNKITAANERALKAERERDYLVEEYERAVGCGSQGYAHAAMHIFNAISNARCDAKVAERERDELASYYCVKDINALRAKHWREAVEDYRVGESRMQWSSQDIVEHVYEQADFIERGEA